jgi:hypothetical protein
MWDDEIIVSSKEIYVLEILLRVLIVITLPIWIIPLILFAVVKWIVECW